MLIQYYFIPVYLKCPVYMYTNLCAPEHSLGRLVWVHTFQYCLEFFRQHWIPLPDMNNVFYKWEDLLHKINNISLSKVNMHTVNAVHLIAICGRGFR